MFSVKINSQISHDFWDEKIYASIRIRIRTRMYAFNCYKFEKCISKRKPSLQLEKHNNNNVF